MKDIFSKEWKYGQFILNVIILTCFSLIAYYHLRSGFSMSSDSVRFSRWSDKLIELNFNLYEFYSIDKAAHRPSLFFFTVPVVLIAICKVFFISYWQYAFILLNLSLLFFTLVIFVKCLLVTGVRPIVISLSLPVIVLSVDILTWPRFILSDMIYAFLVILGTHFIIKLIVKKKFSFLEILLILLLLLGSRPSSVPVILAITSFIIITKTQFFLIKKNILIVIFLMLISTPFLLALVYSIIESNFNEIPKVDFLTSMVKAGMIIHDRPSTWVDVPVSFIDIVHIYFLRIINFFNPYASTFSILHVLLNFFQTFLIFFSLLFWFFSSNHNKVYNQIFFFIVILSFFVASFHSFILIDYDWRYRFPIILPMIMFLPIALEIIISNKEAKSI